MTDDRITDGKRIAQLLASEIDEREDGLLGELAVVDADPGATPSTDGTLAYRVAHEGDEIAAVYLQPERTRIEFSAAVDAAASAGSETRLRVRPTATTLPKTIAFVESGAAVKDAVDVVLAVVRAR